jgi:hypothetical protein
MKLSSSMGLSPVENDIVINFIIRDVAIAQRIEQVSSQYGVAIHLDRQSAETGRSGMIPRPDAFARRHNISASSLRGAPLLPEE